MARRPPEKGKRELTSWGDVQSHERAILSRLRSDSRLLLAAAANPVFALEEAGYVLTAECKQDVEDHLRFGSDIKKIRSLRAQIFELAGSVFELRSSAAVHEVLGG